MFSCLFVCLFVCLLVFFLCFFPKYKIHLFMANKIWQDNALQKTTSNFYIKGYTSLSSCNYGISGKSRQHWLKINSLFVLSHALVIWNYPSPFLSFCLHIHFNTISLLFHVFSLYLTCLYQYNRMVIASSMCPL